MVVLEEYFSNLNQNDKINHSFIIGNTSLDAIKTELENVISKNIIKKDIDIYNDFDIIIIRPDGLFITKDQILEMQKRISITSTTTNKKIYIIDECEKLNNYAANSLLKLLEEPEENIFSFLITNNLEKVLSTIKSRCQILFVSSQNSELLKNIDLEEEEKAINFIMDLEKYNEKVIAYYNKYDFLFDKEKLNNVLNYMLRIYRDVINYINESKLEYTNNFELLDLLKDKNNINDLCNKILIINDIIGKLNYNLNMNLLIDKFIIDFGGGLN